jgi:hypothetical protein
MKRAAILKHTEKNESEKKRDHPVVVLPTRPSLAFYEGCERFHCTAETLKATLEEHGVAIIPSVLNADECAHLESGVWAYYEHLTRAWDKPLKRDDPASWRSFYDLLPMHSMLVQHWGVGHAQFAWDVRQNSKVVSSFAALWAAKEENLLVSFDGSSFHLPPETTGKGWYRGGSWLHTDQRLSDNTFKCVQAWVTPLEVRPGDATLTFLRGSHKHHAEFAQQFGHTGLKSDWYKLSDQAEHDFYLREKGCEHMCVACPAGSMVFWDSRTIHAGIEAMPDRAQPNTRMAIYVCYVPRTRATPKQLEKKRAALKALRTTSHWPEQAKLFGKNPQTYGRPMPKVTAIESPVLTELGMKLAGF